MPENKIIVNVPGGHIIAYSFTNDSYTGIRTEFVADNDNGQNPGRPAVSLEITPDKELQALIYDKKSEDPVDDYNYN